MTAALVAACFAATVFTARRAGTSSRRVAVIGRVSGVPPRSPDRVRSLTAVWREPPTALTAALQRAELALDARQVWRWWTRAVLGATCLGLLLAGPVLGAIAGAIAAGSPLIGAAVLRSRADAGYDATLASALDAIGRGVRSGGSLPLAVTEAAASVRGRVAADLEQIASSVQRGRPFAEAVQEWRAVRDRASVRLTVGALVLATQTGGPPARVIEDVAAAIRVRLQVAREAHALAAQARLSAIVVGVAPLGFMLVSSLSDPRNARVLFGTPIGIACLLTGLALDAVGARWMHRMSAAVSV